MDISTLIRTMERDGSLTSIAQNSRAQFGRRTRTYLGASLLPERLVQQNAYRENSVRYRTVIANDTARYSPVQIKQSGLAGSMLVELGESDIGSPFTAEMYDTFRGLLMTNQSMPAVAQLTNWADVTLNLPLVELNELQRWQAIVDAQVVRRGDGEYLDTVQYPNPSGHRVAQSAPWSTDTTDIFEQIFTMAELLKGKGFSLSRIITSTPVLSKMSLNDTVRTRTGVATINPAGQISATAGRATAEVINAILQRDDIPPIEVYNEMYRTQSGSGYFLKRDVMVFIAATGRDESIDLGDDEDLLPDTLGYMAIGRAAGQAGPGRVLRLEAFEDKPPRIDGQAWQTALPVITEPEAIGIVHSIT